MRSAEFRDWLSKRRWRGELLKPGMIDGRLRRISRVPRALEALGFEERDLDAIHEHGRWPELMSRLKAVVDDWESNERAARAITPRAPDPSRQLNNVYYAVRQYGFFADGRDPNYGADDEIAEFGDIDAEALEALKSRFLAKFPDFEAGGGFTGKSSYHPEEDAYKRPLIAKVQALLVEKPQDEASLGGTLLGLVLDDKDINLVGDYRRKDHLRAVRARSEGKLELAVGVLALSNADPAEAAATFVDKAWPLLLEGSEQSKPFGDIRVLATLFPALVRPQDAICVATRKFDHLGRALLGRPPFGNNVLTAAEYRGILDLAGELFTTMEDWGWQPRDLWDVQGFIWVTCEEKLNMDEARPADRIRKYALDTFITPARQRGDTTVTIRCGDVHTALGMTNAHANVCQALRGRKFQEMAGVAVPSFSGPDNSSTTTFTYELGKSAPVTGSSNVATTSPVNLILYGPPGTGKTYATAAEAVRLCYGLSETDSLLTDPARRRELKRRYDELVEARRIDFVTFHQSYSYEEFVEGLRPVPNASGDETDSATVGFSLQAEDGIFRRISQRAAASKGGGGRFEIGDRKLFKLSIGEAANPEDDYLFEEAIKEHHALLGYGDIDWTDAQFKDRDAIIAACKNYDREHPDEEQRPPTPQAGRVQCPMIFRNWVRTGDLVIVSKGNLKFRAIGEVTGAYEYVPRPTGVYSHRRKVNWLWVDPAGAPVDDILVGKNFSQRAIYELARGDVNIAALEGYIQSQLPGAGPAAPESYVLIIDEINRGNISKIFGELITLIEPDKRSGMSNALEVRLPYSKTPFSVPANLHLVGTMNTADRSIAQLDTALRRRFVFREVAPEPSLLPGDVDGVPLRRVLECMNDRIEYLVDREHRIGHAFFMGDGGTDREAIDRTMRDKVIPLLQEYFFEDWGRIAAVLGEPKGGGFLDCRKLADPLGEGEDRTSWSVRHAFAPDAYDRLIGKTQLTIAEAAE
jgi:5-methylcytosine-specific restriction protein B